MEWSMDISKHNKAGYCEATYTSEIFVNSAHEYKVCNTGLQ